MSMAKAKPSKVEAGAELPDTHAPKVVGRANRAKIDGDAAAQDVGALPRVDQGYLAGAKLLAAPVWVWDLGQNSLFWANPAALDYWAESDLASLRQDGFASVRLNGQELQTDEARQFDRRAFEGIWTAIRSGETLAVPCRITPIQLANETVGLHAEVLPDIIERTDRPTTDASCAQTLDTLIAGIPQGLAWFDADDRLIACNARYFEIYPCVRNVAQPGAAYKEILTTIIEQAARDECAEGEEDSDTTDKLIQTFLEEHKQPARSFEQKLADDRWMLVSEARTPEGGTIMVHTDVTEQKHREVALERSNRELQDFASVASHDLQEPLRKIEAFSERLAAKCTDALGEEGLLYLERMQSAAGRMRLLINDLLSYSRVTTKASPFSPVDLSKIVEDVVSDLQVAVDDANAVVEVGELPTIDADPLQIQLLIQNLISNALKFAQPEQAPHVRIGARILDLSNSQSAAGLPTSQVCEVVVADNGIGFEMKYLERIFNVFQRLHGKDDYPGTGIGLATCRKIAERHNGIITARSELGQGSTFIVRLPVTQSNKEYEE